MCSVLDAIAADRPDAEAIVHRDRRLTRADVAERTNRLADHLAGRGLGCHTGRATLAGHESGQDHLGIYLHNSVEYLESMIGAWKARVAPFNVNYRYVAEELRYVLDDAGTRAIVVHSCFAPTLAEVLARRCRRWRWSSRSPTTRATTCSRARCGTTTPSRGSSAQPPTSAAAPTTSTSSTPAGRPGCRRACCGATVTPWSSASAARGRPPISPAFVAEAHAGFRALIAPPFMHGAGHWVALSVWLGGGTVFVLPHPEHLDPARGLADRRGRGHRLPAHRRRRLRQAVARRARARRLRHLQPQRADVRRRGAVRRLQVRAARPPADADGRRRHGLVGGRRPARPRVHGERRGDRHVPAAAGEPRAVRRPLPRPGAR